MEDSYNSFKPKSDEVVSIKEWLITILILSIPIVNIVMIFVWAFGSGTKTSKSNYFKANLIIVVISFFIFILLYAIMSSTAWSSMINRY
ncbi:MAG TPA: hypothetical protein DC038_12310 [Clostridiales bacterium]|nr:hypothetical protein [Clostridiales bacterium]